MLIIKILSTSFVVFLLCSFVVSQFDADEIPLWLVFLILVGWACSLAVFVVSVFVFIWS